jgi:hypothetical protein
MNPRIKLTIANGEIIQALADGEVGVFIEDQDGIKAVVHTVVPQVITMAVMDAVLKGAGVRPGVPVMSEAEHNRFKNGRFTPGKV